MEDLRHLMGQLRQMSVQAREIRNKRRDPHRKRLHAPKTVQVRQDKVQVHRKPKSGEPSDCFTVGLMRLLIRILSSCPACILAGFAVRTQPIWVNSLIMLFPFSSGNG